MSGKSSSNELCWLSARDIVREVQAKRVSVVEIVDAVLAQIDAVNPSVNAVVTRCDDVARQQARDADAAVSRGEDLGPLGGVPIVVKDLHLTAGLRTTFGSRLYEDHIPDHDQPIVERLRRSGAIILGKTNTPEFGLIPLTMNSVFGDTNNPWDLSHNSGGSSGGSAVAVACGMGPLATASDGGGSIRIPASFCGVFGIKPHLGRVPNFGSPRGWESLSHHGPLSRTVYDAAMFLDAVAGPHPQDRRSLPTPGEPFVTACGRDVRGLKIAFSPDLGGLPIEPGVLEKCRAAAERFSELGCQVEEVELDLDDLTRAQQIIVLCETATGMESRREEWQEVIYPLMNRLLPHADTLTYKDLVRAHWARDKYAESIGPVFEQYDALLTPVSPITAPENGTLGPREIAGRKIRALAWLAFVVPFNMTWQPAASLPVGFDQQGLPVGLQLVGRPYDERTVLGLASAYESAYPWANQRPPASEGPSSCT